MEVTWESPAADESLGMDERGRKTGTQPGRGAQKERGSWRRSLGTAGSVGGKPGEKSQRSRQGLMVCSGL